MLRYFVLSKTSPLREMSYNEIVSCMRAYVNTCICVNGQYYFVLEDNTRLPPPEDFIEINILPFEVEDLLKKYTPAHPA